MAKVTGLSAQVKNPNRVNITVDGKFRFSLDILQVTDLGVKVGKEYTEEGLVALENEGVYGKLYARALEYSMMRPHSSREMRDYLWRKTRATKYKSRTGEIKERVGVTQEVADRVYDRLVEKGYINDEVFARWWVDNRNVRKGASRRKLQAELQTKGVASALITEILDASIRTDSEELAKIITKKRVKYPDNQKLIQYLARQGFGYDDIKSALDETNN